jgi:hypothetical protein
MYLAIAVLYFFPSLFLFQFGSKMKIALNNNDQPALNLSFTKLKAYFRFWGVLTIILISFYAFALIAVIVAGAAFLR